MPNKAAQVKPSMDIIVENVDDCGTGMENIKVLLKDPARKQDHQHPLIQSKESLAAVPCHQSKKIVPSSVDILQLKKKQLLREHHEVTKSVERLASQQAKEDQKVSLPLIKPPRHLVH